MYWKENKYYDESAMTAAATWKEELPEAGALAAIRLQFNVKNATAIQSQIKQRLIDHLTKIEVTNGADKTMFSLRGQQVKALDFYDMGIVPHEKAILYGNQRQRTDVVIPFGRFWKDKDYMLDLAAWDSVYLEITNDLSSTYVYSGETAKVNVMLLTAEDLAAMPAKYIKNYEWRAEKPSAAGQYVYHDLPTTEPIRRVMVQLDPDIATTGAATNDPKQTTSELKFTFLNEKETVLEHSPWDIARMNAFDYGIVETRARYSPSTSLYWDSAIMDVINTVGSSFKQGGGDASDYCELEDTNDRFQKCGALGDQTHLDMITKGVGYYHTLVLFDAKLAPEEEYLDPAKMAPGKGTVRERWYCATADHTFRTCLNVPVEQGAF